MQFDIRPIAAVTMTGLVATAGVNSVVLEWDAPADTSHAATRVYWSQASTDPAAAVLLAQVDGNTYAHLAVPAVTTYYWVRSVNTYGRYDGGWSNMATVLPEDLALAQPVTVTAPTQVFKQNAAGTWDGTSIVLTAVKNGITGAVVWSVVNGTYSGSLTDSAGTLTVNRANMTTASVTFRATVTVGSISYSDNLSIVKLVDGTPGVDAVAGYLTNEAHIVPADSTGLVSSVAGAGGTFKVFNGVTDVTTSAAFTVQANPDSLTASIGAATGIYSVTAVGTWGTSGNVPATLTLRATYNGVTLDKVFTLTKSLVGVTGATGARGSINGFGTPYTLYLSGTSDTSDPWPTASTNAYRANRVIDNLLNGLTLTSNLTSTGHLRLGDMVTLTDSGATTAETRVWSGSNWIKPGVYIDGNLIVDGTVAAAAMDVATLSAITANLGTVTAGEITGTAGLNITGNARFQGTYSGADGIGTVYANETLATNLGGVFYAGAAGALLGKVTGSGTGRYGVRGLATVAGNYGVMGACTHTTSYGVHAYTSVAGTALYVEANTASVPQGKSIEAFGRMEITAINASDIGLTVTTTGATSGAAQFFNTGTTKEFWAAPGAYSAYAPSGKGKYYFPDGAGPFTGFHPALAAIGDYTLGDIVVDRQIVDKPDISNTLSIVELSDAPNQRGALGVVSEVRVLYGCFPEELRYDLWWTYFDTHHLLDVNGVGEGCINVCGEGGDIAPGDLIVTSSTPGKGMRQGDDIVRSCTVAKAREAASFAPGEIRQIACIYLAG